MDFHCSNGPDCLLLLYCLGLKTFLVLCLSQSGGRNFCLCITVDDWRQAFHRAAPFTTPIQLYESYRSYSARPSDRARQICPGTARTTSGACDGVIVVPTGIERPLAPSFTSYLSGFEQVGRLHPSHFRSVAHFSVLPRSNSQTLGAA